MRKAWKWLLVGLGALVISTAFIGVDVVRRSHQTIEVHETMIRKDAATLRGRGAPIPFLAGKDLSLERLSKLPCPAEPYIRREEAEAKLEQGHRGQEGLIRTFSWQLMESPRYWRTLRYLWEGEDPVNRLPGTYSIEQYLLALAVALDHYRAGGYRAREARQQYEVPILHDLSLSMRDAPPSMVRYALETLNQLFAARIPAADFITGEFLLDRAEVLKVIPICSDPTLMMNAGPAWREFYSWRVLIAKSLNQLEGDYYGIVEPAPHETHDPQYYKRFEPVSSRRVHTRSRLGSDARAQIFSDRQALTYWHLARLSAAVCLFQVEKKREPKHLGELAPEYLPAIPACPYGGGAYVYRICRVEAPILDLAIPCHRR